MTTTRSAAHGFASCRPPHSWHWRTRALGCPGSCRASLVTSGITGERSSSPPSQPGRRCAWPAHGFDAGQGARTAKRSGSCAAGAGLGQAMPAAGARSPIQQRGHAPARRAAAPGGRSRRKQLVRQAFGGSTPAHAHRSAAAARGYAKVLPTRCRLRPRACCGSSSACADGSRRFDLGRPWPVVHRCRTSGPSASGATRGIAAPRPSVTGSGGSS